MHNGSPQNTLLEVQGNKFTHFFCILSLTNFLSNFFIKKIPKVDIQGKE